MNKGYYIKESDYYKLGLDKREDIITSKIIVAVLEDDIDITLSEGTKQEFAGYFYNTYMDGIIETLENLEANNGNKK
ncbi:MAG: hypothetical protein LBO69_04805 [Ignavibacteria bacterium]|jgi:hypothetical protein|nr:hypothetical protein [Ignavibacteria bacterium]